VLHIFPTRRSSDLEVLKLEKKISKRVRSTREKTQKEYYLRKQLKAIQKELGEYDQKTDETSQLREKIEASDMPEHVVEVAKNELNRFEQVPQTSPESSVIRNYLDWLITIHWKKKTEEVRIIKS